MIPVNQPLLDGNEKKYLIECIETGWISSEGPFVRQFEEQFAACVGRKHGIAVANGSVALDAAVVALDIGPGDEVILPTFTIISCAAAIVRAGATPVVVDCDPVTWNMDVTHIEPKITPKTKAIMAIHIYGLPVDMDPVLELARRCGLKVIEDAAEAHGLRCRGRRSEDGRQWTEDRGERAEDGRQGAESTERVVERPCGSFGHISTFSFYPNKLVTTGEGGMIVTNDEALAERCRSLRNLCFQKERRFVHAELGWNFRMSNVQAALGVAQLERLDEFLSGKRRMGKRYTELLSDVPGLQLPLPRTDYAENVYWVYGVVLQDDVPFAADEAMRRLAERGIGTRPFFWPMHEQPVFRKMGLFAGERCPVAERLARRGFYLPSGLALTDGQIERAAEAVREVMAAS
jgi:perosamine synthetase